MQQRRTTLGPLSLSHVNSRHHDGANMSHNDISYSMDDHGPMSSMKPPRRSSVSQHANNRKSLVPKAVNMLPLVRVTDPRNISDKSFLNTSIRALIEYLTTHNYEYPISPKVLIKPTNKDFNNIVLFLFKQVDPNFKCTGKFDDEMITMFKYLGYPFQISKANISAVGSPHAWPTLLACIMWLIELLNYDQQMEIAKASAVELEATDIDDPTSSEKAFYRYLGKAYGHFLSGRDDQYDHLERQFVNSFESKNALISDKLENYQQRITNVNAEIEEVKSRSAYLPVLESKRKELQKDYTKFQQLMQQLQQSRAQLQTKVDGRQAEVERLTTLNAAIHKEVQILKDRVQTQELSAEDVMNMMQEKERLEEAQQNASETRQALQRNIWEMEMALRDKVQSLEDTVRAYHTIAEDLKLVPQTARNARGEDLSIEIDIRAKKREGLLKTDVRSTIFPVLQDIRRELTETTLNLRSELIKEQDAAEELEARKHELFESREMFESRLRRAEAVYKREKELLDQASELQRGELDAMENRLLQFRDTAPDEARVTAAARQITELAAIRKTRAVEHKRRKHSMVESIMSVVAIAASHREHVQQTLSQLKDEYHSRLQVFAHPCALQSCNSYSDADVVTAQGSHQIDTNTKALNCSAGDADSTMRLSHIQQMVANVSATKARARSLLTSVPRNNPSTSFSDKNSQHKQQQRQQQQPHGVTDPLNHSDCYDDLSLTTAGISSSTQQQQLAAAQHNNYAFTTTTSNLKISSSSNNSNHEYSVAQNEFSPIPDKTHAAQTQGRLLVLAQAADNDDSVLNLSNGGTSQARGFMGLINACAADDKHLLDDSHVV